MKIVSGGQTGADRAALDVAIELNIPHGGWIPKGRKTEDGSLDERYQLQEMSTESYSKRTEQNVIDSDGTLIVTRGKLSDGSYRTYELTKKHKRPCLHINMEESTFETAAQKIKLWIVDNGIQILNVAGPRASKDQAIYGVVKELLTDVFGNGHSG